MSSVHPIAPAQPEPEHTLVAQVTVDFAKITGRVFRDQVPAVIGRGVPQALGFLAALHKHRESETQVQDAAVTFGAGRVVGTVMARGIGGLPAVLATTASHLVGEPLERTLPSWSEICLKFESDDPDTRELGEFFAQARLAANITTLPSRATHAVAHVVQAILPRPIDKERTARACEVDTAIHSMLDARMQAEAGHKRVQREVQQALARLEAQDGSAECPDF